MLLSMPVSGLSSETSEHVTTNKIHIDLNDFSLSPEMLITQRLRLDLLFSVKKLIFA